MPKTNAERQAEWRANRSQDACEIIDRLARIEEKLDRLLIPSLHNALRNKTPLPTPQPTRASLTELPEDWELDDNLIAYTRKYGLNPELTLEDFKNYWCGTGRRMRSWPRTYMRWCREQAKRNEADERKERKYINGEDTRTKLSGPRPPTTAAPTLRDLGLEE